MLLRQLREDQGMRQAYQATRLGQPASFVCHVEKGNVMLDMPQIRQVAHALRLTLGEIVDLYKNALKREGLKLCLGTLS